MRKLNNQQIQFAHEYVATGNAYQSAIKAGYAEKYAKAQSSKLLENVGIKSLIDKLMAEIKSYKIMDAREAMELLTSIARGEVTESRVVGTQDGAEVVDVEADLKTKISAIKEILKRYPAEDPIIEQQLRKLKADADISYNKARISKVDADNAEGVGEINPIIKALADKLNERDVENENMD